MFMCLLAAASSGRGLGRRTPSPSLGVRRGCRRRCGVPALRAAAGALFVRTGGRVLRPVIDAVLLDWIELQQDEDRRKYAVLSARVDADLEQAAERIRAAHRAATPRGLQADRSAGPGAGGHR